MAQINVTYDDAIVAALDRVAASRRLARPELLRAIATEAVEAHDAGRLAFQRDDGPRLDASISGLVVQLRETLTECDRMQKENLRFAKRLQEAFTGSEQTVRAALDKLSGRIRELNRQSYQPFVEKLDGLTEHVEAAEERTQAAVAMELAGIDKRLGQVMKVASSARTTKNLVLGDDRVWSARFLTKMAGMVGLVFVVMFLILAQQVQPLALFTAEGLINSDERLCILVNRHVGAADCRVPDEVRERALNVLAAEAEE